MQNIYLNLTIAEAKLLHDALIRLPYGQVESLVGKVREAIIASQKPLAPQAPAKG